MPPYRLGEVVGHRAAHPPEQHSYERSSRAVRCARAAVMPALERETVHPLLLPRWAQPHADEHHVVHDRRARRDDASEVELPEQRTRPGIEGPQLTRAVAHEEQTAGDPSGPEAEDIALRRRTLPRDGAVRGVASEDVSRSGEGGGQDLP